ncbi:Gfo/Idh/MocA family protein [Mahella australiensis]|uniref:Oxidoreductase domain protein n=1 Tax=Mahella australiensis (strain DSM 15567 / CIP 107919 / 50-1 BON) TaxID=697281 RepID=F3ZW31_MAHA5|nr:Gfo/Idh/MocA family oxidoreductase [Mahella australiensis]AEE96411.1 oxidoreductase domain protein [Mahella australiensis 50-1 BON]
MLRVCVIGMGPIGNLHANIYKEDALAQLVGVCDIVPERAESAGKRLGVPWFTDAQEMLDELAPDLCSVATGGYEYGSDHYEPTIQALSAGCHVLCEKPICNEIPKAERMVALAREKGLCFGVDFNHRFTPAARLARKWVDDGRLGEPLFLNMALWIGKPQDFESPYFHLKALNPHSVDTMRHFCGDITRVQCFAMKAPGRTIWSTASINVQFRNGAVGHLTSSYDIKRGHPMERCEFAGTKGRFVLDDMWREATLYPADSLEKTVYTNPVFGGYRDFDDTFKARLHRFLEQVGEGTKPEDIDGTGADGLAAQRVIAAAIKSLDTGEIVNVED